MEIAFKSRTGIQYINNLSKTPIIVPLDKAESQVNNRLEIIIADDDEDDQELLAEAISEISSNTNIRLAGNGKDLMKKLRELTLPDLVFLDLNMPLMNGFECLELIKKDPKLKNVPVLIYSTSANPDQIERTFQDGAHLYIQKPSNITELKNIVKKIMDITWDNSALRPTRKEFLLGG
ncbi:response regulator [Aquiflexum sp.]|uniref:response regulator n=1 Tax=Aquiflexum sp. TaxID=1872584 RepID=UPI0035938192